jgi:3-deoxy-D-manno-octulosonate 8-phosphate phosphatase (KDO 8-P phosphatase)
VIKNGEKKVLVLDLDGVLTDGKFYYSAEGKQLKAFGPDDHDAIKVIQKYLEVVVVTADKLGFEISRRRVETDMSLNLHLVDSVTRAKWIQRTYKDYFTIYMGDGFYDHQVFDSVDFGIAPANACKSAKESANYVTNSSGGDRAVSEACIYIIKNILKLNDLDIYL